MGRIAEGRKRRLIRNLGAAEQMPEPYRCVISRWLHLCRVGHWTPFEAAMSIEKELDRDGYMIVRKPDSHKR